MKQIKHRIVSAILIIILGVLPFISCIKPEEDILEPEEVKTGFVTFGANYHTINTNTILTVFVDDENIGILENPTDSLINCNEETNLNKELSIGEHSYRIEIRPESGTDYNIDTSGKIPIYENGCEKIFIDYNKLFISPSKCDKNVIISDTEFGYAPKDSLSLSNMIIEEDCLKIIFSATGYDGNDWTVNLIALEGVAQSNPPQRTLRLSLDNLETCETEITKEISFDILDLQVSGTNEVIFNFFYNNDYKISYKY